MESRKQWDRHYSDRAVHGYFLRLNTRGIQALSCPLEQQVGLYRPERVYVLRFEVHSRDLKVQVVLELRNIM